MKAYATSTMIHATPHAVWAVLTDGAQWTEWNPTVDKVEGNIGPGAKVAVYAKLNPGRAFPVKVSTFEPPRRMVWTGGMPLGLFKGERTYTLTPKAGGVEFAMREQFTGLLAPLIGKSIPNMQPAFEAFAAALKRRCEQLP
jgi:hypothetical protein